MNEYSKSLDITKEELKKQINEIKNEFKQDDTIEISLYLSIINNDFIELELIYNDIRITLTKENNEINYKYYDSLIIKYQGYISIKEENEHYQVSFSIEDIEQEMTIELKTSIKLEFNQDIDILDTNNAVDINSLTEDDYNKITTNISNNENLKNLLEDFISLFAIYAEETNYLQTT